MTVAGKGQNAGVAVTVTSEDGTETSVKAVYSDYLVRTPEGLVSKNELIHNLSSMLCRPVSEMTIAKVTVIATEIVTVSVKEC